MSVSTLRRNLKNKESCTILRFDPRWNWLKLTVVFCNSRFTDQVCRSTKLFCHDCLEVLLSLVVGQFEHCQSLFVVFLLDILHFRNWLSHQVETFFCWEQISGFSTIICTVSSITDLSAFDHPANCDALSWRKQRFHYRLFCLDYQSLIML